MRLKTEKVLNDIEAYLEETAELPWGTAHIILMEAKDQINSLQRQLDNKELTDEEIMDELVKVKHTWVATTSVWYEFEKEELKKAIRAILRKAQENGNV